MLERFNTFIHNAQDAICSALEAVDGKATFREDLWERPGGGGGRTRVIANGNAIEKGGVNISMVHGELPEAIRSHFGVKGGQFSASGISLVIHPRNPFVPTVHANYRYFEVEGDAWFGGGADLTPYYLFPEDATHFHRKHKDACDRIDTGFYPDFKRQCDAYFYNSHRLETRGVGGIFYDYQRPDAKHDKNDWLMLARANAEAFVEAYIPIVERRKNTPYTAQHRYWQEIRRGRYAEFNLIHDRGTLFGLKTDGRIESILMSLPPQARWDYDHHPVAGSPEAAMLEVLKKPVEWV